MAEANPAGAWYSGRVVRILLIVGRLVLGGVFLYAAYEKLRDPWLLFAMTVNSYQMLPEWGVLWMARTLPWVELGLGALLVIGAGVRWVSSATSVLMLIFIAAISHAMILGLEINCGCFGGTHSVKLRTELLQDIGLLLVALFVTADAFRAHRARRLPA